MADSPQDALSRGRAIDLHPFGGEDRFRHLLDQAPTSAYTCDPTGLITYFNAQASQLWGRSPILYDPAWRYCGSYRLFAADGTPIPHDRCWMALALVEDRPFNGHEILIERPDGQRIHALAFANPLHGEDGRLVGGVNLLMDVSEDWRAESEIRKLQAEIRERAGARIGALVATISAMRRSLVEARTIPDIIPVCSWCKLIRTRDGTWQPLESYLWDQARANVTHGMCPSCLKRYTSKINLIKE